MKGSFGLASISLDIFSRLIGSDGAVDSMFLFVERLWLLADGDRRSDHQNAVKGSKVW